MSNQEKAGKVLVTWLDSTDTETSSEGLLAFSREIAVMCNVGRSMRDKQKIRCPLTEICLSSRLRLT